MIIAICTLKVATFSKKLNFHVNKFDLRCEKNAHKFKVEREREIKDINHIWNEI